jgi:hypothetical protein
MRSVRVGEIEGRASARELRRGMDRQIGERFVGEVIRGL